VPITPTPRLALNKQVAGDPAWDAALNTGFDNADARFLIVRAGTPVGVQQGFYVGQLCLDTNTTQPTQWICTVVGNPGTWKQPNTPNPIGNLTFPNTFGIQLQDNAAVPRVGLYMSVANVVVVGDVTEIIRLQTLNATSAVIAYGAGDKTVWHSGNDGAGSGLDADTLAGFPVTNFLQFAGTSYAELGPLTPVANAVNSAGHAFGARPRFFTAWLRNINAEGGYSVGDEVQYGNTIQAPGVHGTYTLWASSTQVGISNDANAGILIGNKGGAGAFFINTMNWNLYFRIWK
jgi:hypothetical protein